MKLSDIVHQSQKTIACAACIIFVLIIVLRVFTFQKDRRDIQQQLVQYNRIAHQEAANTTPFVSLAGRQTPTPQWKADGFIVYPGTEFQIQLSFWNNLNTPCLNTTLSATTKKQLISATPTIRYYDTKGNDCECLLGMDPNRIELNTKDHYPREVFFLEQTYKAKIILFGNPTLERIDYTVSNEHFLTTASYYVGIVPICSWEEVAEFIIATTYMTIAIILECYDSHKNIKSCTRSRRKRSKID